MASKEYRGLITNQNQRSKILDLPHGEEVYKKLDSKLKSKVTLK